MLGYQCDDIDLTGYGYIGGQALLGSTDLTIEVPSSPQVNAGVNKSSPDVINIPYFLSKFTQQVKVMLTPAKLFQPQTLPDPTPYYGVSNHPVHQPTLVFQSPLEYIGLPNEG